MYLLVLYLRPARVSHRGLGVYHFWGVSQYSTPGQTNLKVLMHSRSEGGTVYVFVSVVSILMLFYHSQLAALSPPLVQATTAVFAIAIIQYIKHSEDTCR